MKTTVIALFVLFILYRIFFMSSVKSDNVEKNKITSRIDAEVLNSLIQELLGLIKTHRTNVFTSPQLLNHINSLDSIEVEKRIRVLITEGKADKIIEMSIEGLMDDIDALAHKILEASKSMTSLSPEYFFNIEYKFNNIISQLQLDIEDEVNQKLQINSLKDDEIKSFIGRRVLKTYQKVNAIINNSVNGY